MNKHFHLVEIVTEIVTSRKVEGGVAPSTFRNATYLFEEINNDELVLFATQLTLKRIEETDTIKSLNIKHQEALSDETLVSFSVMINGFMYENRSWSFLINASVSRTLIKSEKPQLVKTYLTSKYQQLRILAKERIQKHGN